MRLSEDVKMAINEMFMSRDLLEHMTCYQHHINELKDWTFVVFSEDDGTKLPDALCTNYDNKFAIINLGRGDRYYAVDQQICEDMLRTGVADYYIDVCVELDTQAVSYLKNVFEEYNQIPNYENIKELVHYLQLPSVNYSCLPYLVENAAKKDSINRIECYRNIKSFMLFKSYDHERLLRKESCVYDRSEEDIQIDVDSLYNDVFSEKFAQYYGDFFEMQKGIYALLLKAISIEFENSKRAAKNKMYDLIHFVNDELGFIAEREMEICYHYFAHDDRTKKFFKCAQKNSKDIFNSIKGMAWDLTHVRLVEREYMTLLVNDLRFAIHMLLTFDNGLKDLLKINPIEQIALCNGTAIPKFQNRWLEDIDGAYEMLMSPESVQRRCHTSEMRNMDELCNRLEDTLGNLCDIS